MSYEKFYENSNLSLPPPPHHPTRPNPPSIHGGSAKWVLCRGAGEHLAAGGAGNATTVAALPAGYQPIGAAAGLWHCQTSRLEK